MWLDHCKGFEQRTLKNQTNHERRIKDGNWKIERSKFTLGEENETNRQERYWSKTGRRLNNEPNVINELKRVSVYIKQDRRDVKQNSWASNWDIRFDVIIKFKEQDNWEAERFSVVGWEIQVTSVAFKERDINIKSEGVFIWEDFER